ncbi:MAG TPA: glycosyltransferase family 2 protein [Acetobacteraceae bacterium]|nr:glycosyltransferase family 2 protein [Acetobacteraceae bacterium]
MHIEQWRESRAAIAPRIAVLIPCHNEAASIARVIAGFQAHLPDARILVFDNNSTDATGRIAADAGAETRSEPLQGKGHVVRRAFADVDADIYILVDGDDTYDAAAAPGLVATLIENRLDMVVGTRLSGSRDAFPSGHRTGNRAINAMVRFLFGARISDLLSGYRVLSRRFVKSFPALAAGFEIETELTLHALALDMSLAEIPCAYRPRGRGSVSKLRTYPDGARIALTILTLLRDQKPLPFFGLIGLLLMLGGLGLGAPVVLTFLRTGLVPRLPTALLATGLELIACLALTCGIVLDSVARGRLQAKRLAYLAIPPWGERG